jgi:RES domain-containing protein
VTIDVTLWRIGADTPDYEARSLACLETLVHLAKHPLPLNRYLVKITVPAAAWRTAMVLDGATLVGWDAEPPSKASLDWGTDWARASSTLLARVPSVVVPDEFNVLINPTHPDSGGVKAEKARKWLYDFRLAPKGS